MGGVSFGYFKDEMATSKDVEYKPLILPPLSVFLKTKMCRAKWHNYYYFLNEKTKMQILSKTGFVLKISGSELRL